MKAVQDNRIFQAHIAQQVQHVLEAQSSESDVRKALSIWFWDDVDKDMLTQEQFLFNQIALFAHLPETGITMHSLYEIFKFEHSILAQVCSTPAEACPRMTCPAETNQYCRLFQRSCTLLAMPKRWLLLPQEGDTVLPLTTMMPICS